MSRARIVGRSADPSKPFHHIYGRNRYSKNLVLVSSNIRDYKEAQRELRELKAASGHDYTYTISSSFEQIR